ncbi:hypothetical protein HW846_46360 [Streptomyces sp. NE06-02F]|uniref:hypothetical protein n=1 Tax=Streptomyces caniscabiei TaxID=2746961 RepID=UPI001872AFD2|nr:hypothetical protein [Streptomyces caniscabiei]MBE4790670.1 hypothetical protein [Streptomyces caniscabiei]MDX2941038.1 hypothetical protein [Streptomyces caniscabiei]
MPSIPVVRAETFYQPSHPQPPGAWALIAPAERVIRWYEDRVQRRVRPPDGFVIGQKAFARINHNRWVADCPCGSAQVVTPADPRMACTECGYGWLALVFPEDVAAVEESVVDKLPHLRNWWHPDDPVSWGHPPSDAVDPLDEEDQP